MICNPYLPPYEYVPDGEPYVFQDRLYIYGSHDQANNPGFCVEDYVVWSAPCEDLSKWKYEGISYKRTEDPHNEDGAHALFAPDVVRGKDGNYYLYYCLDFLEEFGVAKSSQPQGPFTFYGHVRRQDGSLLKEFFPYDPSVLIDDDGRIYLYYGFSAHFTSGSFGKIAPSPGCMVVQLEDDMLTIKTEPKVCLSCEDASCPPEHAYFEAPSMRKINDLYYLVYSSQSQHELCYATGRYPDKDFTYRGVIISNGDIGYRGNQKAVNYVGTNHGGLVGIQGEWYIFYHRNTHGLATSRQGCAERIVIKEDGAIEQVPVTSYGLKGKPFEGKGEYPAYIACYLERSDTQPKMSYGKDYKETEPYFYENRAGNGLEHYIANIINNTKWGYHAFDLDRNVSIQLVLKGQAEGNISVYADREGDQQLGRMNINMDAEEWVPVAIDLQNPAGISNLYFFFHGTGSLNFKALIFV